MLTLTKYLKQLAVPLGIVLIFSSCFVLAWYLYQTVYQPLFTAETAVISASDYAVPTVKLNHIIEALQERSQSNVDFSGVPNRFAPEQKQSE